MHIARAVLLNPFHVHLEHGVHPQPSPHWRWDALIPVAIKAQHHQAPTVGQHNTPQAVRGPFMGCVLIVIYVPLGSMQQDVLDLQLKINQGVCIVQVGHTVCLVFLRVFHVHKVHFLQLTTVSVHVHTGHTILQH